MYDGPEVAEVCIMVGWKMCTHHNATSAHYTFTWVSDAQLLRVRGRIEGSKPDFCRRNLHWLEASVFPSANHCSNSELARCMFSNPTKCALRFPENHAIRGPGRHAFTNGTPHIKNNNFSLVFHL